MNNTEYSIMLNQYHKNTTDGMYYGTQINTRKEF